MITRRNQRSKSNTDKRVANLQIDVIRRFTGFYAEEELEAAKSQREESKKEQETALAKIAERFEDIKKRENQIPGEIADLTINVNNVSRSLEDAESELGEYDSIFEQIVRICEKYSHESTAAFTGVLSDEIRRDIDTTEADIATKKRKLDSLKEKRKAAESGYLHILPEIMAYVNSTGLNPTTGEEYICGLIEAGTVSVDRAEEILGTYPEMAYALLFNNEKDIKRLLSAGNIEWLPAVVPLFTMAQIDHIFDGTKEAGAFLTAHDKSFFADREGYFDRLSDEISNLEDRLAQLLNHLQEGKGGRKEMQTMTSAYANKMLKSLEEDKAFWVNKEATSSTYVAAINEEPVVPEYDYTEVVATITSLDEKIAIIKHALNVTNSNEKVQVGDAEMSIDTILIKMAQLNKRKSVLDQMRKQLPKAREEQRSYMSRNTVPEYRYINYDLELIKKEYEAVSKTIMEMQMALDKYNQTVQFEVDI